MKEVHRKVMSIFNTSIRAHCAVFFKEAWCSPAQFSTWVKDKDHPNLASFTKWLLLEEKEGEGMKLVADPDPPTFYQTLAKKYAGQLCN